VLFLALQSIMGRWQWWKTRDCDPGSTDLIYAFPITYARYRPSIL